MSILSNSDFGESLRQRLDCLAKTQGVTSQEIIRKALEEYIDNHDGNSAQAEQTASPRILELANNARSLASSLDWQKLPVDLAKNFDHHLYGHPRENP